jgi:hypothetical protein
MLGGNSMDANWAQPLKMALFNTGINTHADKSMLVSPDVSKQLLSNDVTEGGMTICCNALQLAKQ